MPAPQALTLQPQKALGIARADKPLFLQNVGRCGVIVEDIGPQDFQTEGLPRTD